ncbi:hypothetical protein Rhopal_000214-T1 [Rhodotorula paludigena]|uniref:t-SNARE coiled-coil homology domain-containing protein n=1 Tax=Rhodotorula paludigena TaxID=86838 RepID=A0AAV5GCA3_9BASI|nr:hypothetical protein Rhopal_000214-T1 [Rhodotorula paludigena]
MGRGGSGGGYGTIVYTNRSATSLNRSLHSRSSSTGSRRYGSRDQANDEPVPPVPSLPLPPHDNTDYTSPPLASDAHYLQTPPEVPLPRDFDPNDSRAQYAVNYAPAYMTPPQSRHETQYTPANPRQTRQRSISTVPGVSAAATGARKTSMVPIAPTASQRAYEQDSLGGGEEYGEEKASTVDLVERDDGHERRESTVKRGGPTISKGQVPFEESGEFFQEVSDLQQALREANGSIQAVGDLQMRMLALPSSEDRMAQEVKSQLDAKTATTCTLFTSIKDRVHVLDQGNANLRAMIPLGQSLHNLSLEEVAIRQDQVDALKERFKNAIQRYAEVERDYRKNQRARMERQVKVVNPGMSAVEIEEIVKQAEAGGDSAMFSQALQTNGYRSQAARGALKEVQNRAAELARIEATLIELSQLFQDMAVMVYAQDVTIQRIEQDAIKTEQDMEHGLGNVKKAVVHARNARKYRWWCFGIIVVILLDNQRCALVHFDCHLAFDGPVVNPDGYLDEHGPYFSLDDVDDFHDSRFIHYVHVKHERVDSRAKALDARDHGNLLNRHLPSVQFSYLITSFVTLTLPDSILGRLSMKGKTTIVTGGSGGIGFAAAEAIAEVGGDVALAYRSAQGMDERAADLAKKYGTKVKAYKCDVASYEEVTKLVQDVKADFGRVDAFIANAGMGGSGRIKDLSLEDWRKIQAVNFDSVFYAMKAVGPVFEEQGSGSFVATTSMSAHIVNVPLDQSAYNASKAAVVHLCKSVARDWRKFARVNTISPGFVDTPMGAAPAVAETCYRNAVLGRQGDPKELAGAFLYLCSNASTYTTGADLIIDGGYTLS